MSKVIDERVVSMQFDNKHFESNVQTTMSTLDKLKAKLNFTGSAKSFESINAAAGKCNLSPLSNAVDTVGLKFSAMYTIADQALRNITNSAMRAGKNIISALTIDPVKTGLSEYETQINSTQTILANTKSKGSTIEDVNKALEELNAYADKTIYNFTEMTRNIGTFTAAGVDLETSVNAIQGIANLAAVSGSTSQQASTAMYQLSQALAAGKVSLMDWNSVVNAGMGGELFQNALKETSRELGTGADKMIEKYGSFRESLSKGEWLTTEVLTETLKKFTSTGAIEQVAKYTGLTEDAIDATIKSAEAQYGEKEAIEQASKALAEKSGKNAEEIKSVLEFAKDAEDAATKVKTFSQMWDVMKESAQSGWSQTWKIIFGDFEEAKAIFTPLTDFFTGIINKISDARNTFLEAALGSPLGQLAEKIGNFTESTGSAVDALGDYSEIVDRVLSGEFGTGQERWDKLTEMGYNWAHAQNLVNEKLGNSFRRVVELTDAQGEQAEVLKDLTDEKLKELGLTESEIKLYRELEKQSKETGKSISEIIDESETRTGRELLIDSFKNIGSALVDIGNIAGKAWKQIFNPIDPKSLYDKIDAFEEFTAGIKAFWKNTDNVDDLTRVFKGLFAVLDIVKTVIGGGLSIAFRAVSGILGLFNMDILDAAAYVGDLLVKLRDWIDEHSLLNKIFDEFGPSIKAGIISIRDWIKESGLIGKAVSKISDFLSNSATAIINWFKGFGSTDDIFGYIVKSLQNGAKNALNGIKNLGSTVGKFIAKIFESPLKVISEFKDKVLDKLGVIGDGISGFIDRIVDFVKRLDISFGGVAAILTGAGIVVAFVKFANVFSKVVGLVSNISEAFAGIGESISGAFDKIGNAAKIIGLAVAIAIIAKVFLELAKLEWKEIGRGIGVLAGIAAVLFLLNLGLGALSKKGIEATTGALTLLGIASAIAILAYALKMVTNLESDNIVGDILILAGIGAALVIVTAALSKLAPQISKGSVSMIAIAAAILILVVAVSKIDALKIENPEQTILTLVGLIAGLALLSAVTKGVKLGSAVGIIGMVAALFIFIKAVEALANVDMVKIKSNIEEVAIILGMFAVLMLSSTLAGKNVGKAGAGILAMSAALILVIAAIKLIATVSPTDLSRGVEVITQLLLMFALITAASILAGSNAAKAGLMLMEMSVALLLISGAIAILAHISSGNEAGLEAATNTIMKLMAMFAVIIVASSFAKSAMGTLITIGVVLGLLTVALGILSTIPDSDLTSATMSLVLIMGAFAGLIAVTKLINVGKGTFLKTAGTLVVMTLVIAGLGLVLANLASLEPGRAMEAATSLGLLLVSLSASLILLSVAGWLGGAVAGIIGLVALIAVVGGLMAAINAIVDDAEAAEAGLDTAIMVLEKIGTGIGSFIGGIIGGLGAGIFSGLEQMAADLNNFMTEMTKEGGFIEGAKSVDESAVNGIKTLMEMLMMFAGAEFLGSLADTSDGIISKVAGLFGKYDNPVLSLAEKMTEMGEALVAFSNSTSGLDDTAIDRVSKIAEICKTLVDLADSIPNEGGWLGEIFGENDISVFGTKLPALGAGIVAFAGSVRDLTDEDIDKIKVCADAAMALATMADSVPNMGGRLAEFFGENDLAVFGQKLTSFGLSLVMFGVSIRALTKDDIDKINMSAEAATGLAAMADAVPNMGGKLAVFFGENDLAVFGEKLVSFGTSLVTYAESIRGLTEDDVKRINLSSEAASGLAAMAEAVPNMGGLFAEVFGENDLATFGSQISGFGTSLMAYATSILGLTDAHITAIDKSKLAVESLTKVAKAVPNEGGLWGAIAGENNVIGFATGMMSLGNCIIDYARLVANVDDETVDTIKNSRDAVEQLAKIAKETPELDKDQDLSGFATNVPKIGHAISDYAKAVRTITEEDVDNAKKSADIVDEIKDAIKNLPSVIKDLSSSSVNDAIDGLKKIVTFAGDLEDSDTSGLASLGKNLERAAKDGVSKFVKVFADSRDDIKVAANNLVRYLYESIEDNGSTVTSAFTNLIKAIVNAITNSQATFYSAGANICQAFARGISDYSYVAINRAKSLAASVTSIVKDTLGIRSPSKVFMEIGNDVVDGFSIGLKNSMSLLNNAGVAMVTAITSPATSYFAATSKLATVYGEYTTEGFASGIHYGVSSVSSASESMAIAAHDAIIKTLEIHSPSKKTEKDGEYVAAGMTKGINDNAELVETASGNMAQSVVDAIGDALSNGDIPGVSESFLKEFSSSIIDAITEMEPPDEEQLANFATFLARYIDIINDVVKNSGLTSSAMAEIGDFIQKIGIGLGAISLGMSLITASKSEDVERGITSLERLLGLLTSFANDLSLTSIIKTAVNTTPILNIATAITEIAAVTIALANFDDTEVTDGLTKLEKIAESFKTFARSATGLFSAVGSFALSNGKISKDFASTISSGLLPSSIGSFFKNLSTAIIEIVTALGLIRAYNKDDIDYGLDVIEDIMLMFAADGVVSNLVAAFTKYFSGANGFSGSINTTAYGLVIAFLTYLITELSTIGQENITKALDAVSTLTHVILQFGTLMAILAAVSEYIGVGNLFIAIGAIDALVASLSAIIGLVIQNAIHTFTENIDSWGEKLVGFGQNLSTFVTYIEDVATRMAGIETAWIIGISNFIDLYHQLSALDKELESESEFTGLGDLFNKAVADAFDSDISESAQKACEVIGDFMEELGKTLDTFTEEDLDKIAAIGPSIGSFSESAKTLFSLQGISERAAEISLMADSIIKLVGGLTDLANVDIESINDIIANLANTINTDMEIEPTITPVVDMSNVEQSAGYMNDLFGSANITASKLPDVTGISANINTTLEDRGNDKVVEAINKLAGKIEGLETGDTYTINGITYDDGSEVADAMQAIIRAARVQGRS